MPLSVGPDQPTGQETMMPGLDTERLPPEPAERRVMRTLAQALTAVDRVVIQPEPEPTVSKLHPAVVAGASRELIAALHTIVSSDAVATFEAGFRWADALPGPSQVLSEVRISAEAAPRLDRAARLLKASTYSPDQVVTGPIVEVRHEMDDPFGYISIQTVRSGRPAEVRVRLSEAQLIVAFDWARDRRAVLCEGRIRRGPGQPLIMDQPRRVQPLDETYLLA